MKIRTIIEQKGMCSVMNTTKWKELKIGISKLPFEPPFVIKTVDEKESEYHTFEEDIYHTMDWGLYLDNYLGGDIYATEYFEIEWIKVRPRILKKQGKLIPDKIIDETEEFVAVLQKYSIPFEEENGTYIIYGYQ